jgi:hypothetical protein
VAEHLHGFAHPELQVYLLWRSVVAAAATTPMGVVVPVLAGRTTLQSRRVLAIPLLLLHMLMEAHIP